VTKYRRIKGKLINLIEIKVISSEEVIKISTELDKLIVKHYQKTHNINDGILIKGFIFRLQILLS